MKVHFRYPTRHVSVALALAALTLMPSLARAQDEIAPVEPEGPNQGKISISGSIGLTTEYWFRGIIQETEGVQFQPDLSLTFSLYENEAEDALLQAVSITGGIWNSIHTEETGATGGTASPWYEADGYFSLDFTFADKYSFGLGYTAYTSPNGAFGTTQEIGLTFGYDDTGRWTGLGLPESFAISPEFLVAFEFDGGADGIGDGDGVYFQLSFGPSFDILDSEDFPVSLSIPVTFGFGSDYYEFASASGIDDDAFGYFDVGLVFSTPLKFIPSDYGSWEAYAGVHFIVFGDSASDINDEDTSVYGTFGISFTY